MSVFLAGATIVCSITIKDDGVLTDPATSVTITIYDPMNTAVASAVTMLPKDDVGLYHYDYNSSSTALRGEYIVIYTSTDGTKITKQKDTFYLE